MTVEDLVRRLKHLEPSNEKMIIGTGWHKVLENPDRDVIEEVTVDGYTYVVDFDAKFALPHIKETKATKEYIVGDVLVTLVGKLDGITGNRIRDYKVTFKAPNPESYNESYQWRAYLDIFGCDALDYYVFQASNRTGSKKVVLKNFQIITQYGYFGMKKELVGRIGELVDFIKTHAPEMIKESDDDYSR